MATLYLNTESLNYKLLYWKQSVSYSSIKAVDPQESSILRAGSVPWVHIFPFLGERTINMRGVCAFFLQPCFEEIYKASPITPEGVAYRNIVLGMILHADRLITNRALYFRKQPSIAGWMQPENLAEAHWKQIVSKMLYCQSVGPVDVKEVIDYFGKGKNPDFLSRITHFVIGGDYKLSYEIRTFQNLSSLSYSGQMLSEDFLKLEPKSLPALRVFECHLIVQLNLAIFSHLCRAMPNLEELRLTLINRNEEGVLDALELPSNAMRSLKKLSISIYELCVQDMLILLQAAPFLQQLEFNKYHTLADLCKVLLDNSFSALRRLIVKDSRFSWGDWKKFLMAAPRLSLLSVNEMKGDVYNPEMPQMPFLRSFDFKGTYESARVLNVNQCFVEERYPNLIYRFIPWMFKMPQLEEVRIKMVKLSDDIHTIYNGYPYSSIPQGFFQNVRTLYLKDLIMKDLMLMLMLKNALRLQKLHLEDIQFDRRAGLIVSNLEGDALGELTDLQIQNIDIQPISLGALFAQSKKLERVTVKSHLVKNPSGEYFIDAFDLIHLTYCRLDGYKNLDANAWVTLLKAAPNVGSLYMDQRLIYPVVQKLHEEGLVLQNLRGLFYSHDPNNKGDKILLPTYFSEIAPQFQVLNMVRD